MALLDSAVLFRDLGREPTLITHGDGVYLYDDQGKRYLDAACGAAVTSLGHGNREIAAVMAEQAATLSFAHISKFATQPMVDLAEALVARAQPPLKRVYFTSGGSESTEAALKLARQYHLAHGRDRRHKLIARHTSYHGATLGALAISGQKGRRELFEPMLTPELKIPPAYPYRCALCDNSCSLACADALEQTILDADPDTVAAFIAEPIVGSSIPGSHTEPAYWRRLREICDRYDVLLIADEVMSGNGRSGKWWAMEHAGVVPDMITTAKGIGAGYASLGAVLLSEAIYKAVGSSPGYFRHGHTYGGNPVACAVGLKVIEIIERDGLLAHVTNTGDTLQRRLRDTLGDHPHVGEIRGLGLLLGIEFVADKASKTPFDPSLNVKTRFSHACLSRGLYVYQGGGSVDGVRGDHTLIAPPFILQDEHIDVMVTTMAEALDEVAQQVLV